MRRFFPLALALTTGLVAACATQAPLPTAPGAAPAVTAAAPQVISVGTGHGSVTIGLSAEARRALLASPIPGVPFYSNADVHRIELDVMRAEEPYGDNPQQGGDSPEEPYFEPVYAQGHPVRFVGTSLSQTFVLTDLGPGTYKLQAYAYQANWSGVGTYGENPEGSPDFMFGSYDDRFRNCINQTEDSFATFTIGQDGKGQVRTVPLKFKPRPVTKAMPSAGPTTEATYATGPVPVQAAFSASGWAAIANTQAGGLSVSLKQGANAPVALATPAAWTAAGPDVTIVPGPGSDFLVVGRVYEDPSYSRFQALVAKGGTNPGATVPHPLATFIPTTAPSSVPAAFFDGAKYQVFWASDSGLVHCALDQTGSVVGGVNYLLNAPGQVTGVTVAQRSATQADLVIARGGALQWADFDFSPATPASPSFIEVKALEPLGNASVLLEGCSKPVLSLDAATHHPLLVWFTPAVNGPVAAFLAQGSRDISIAGTAGNDGYYYLDRLFSGSAEQLRAGFDPVLGEHVLTAKDGSDLMLRRVAGYQHQAVLSSTGDPLFATPKWALVGGSEPNAVATGVTSNVGLRGVSPWFFGGNLLKSIGFQIAPAPAPLPPGTT